MCVTGVLTFVCYVVIGVCVCVVWKIDTFAESGLMENNHNKTHWQHLASNGSMTET